ncbi:hypothetical protein AVEN_133086-1 [Araneus ventricosus]|uniref:Uncharacterized protein n=1 Tax=Araneus ventricosus TaxID=182803 RepID=A0A4Y2WXL8_ARAVE|nr:hypothetical protein AVEN_133086-1 [Araneus ventricosus]
MVKYTNYHNFAKDIRLKFPADRGIEVYASPNTKKIQYYAKNQRGEIYAKDEDGNEYTNQHAYARANTGGQYYPKLKNKLFEVYSYFGDDRQKYAKDKFNNQFYPKIGDDENVAIFQNEPKILYYYAKNADDVEKYPIKSKNKEMAYTGEYRRAKNNEEFYPKIYV